MTDGPVERQLPLLQHFLVRGVWILCPDSLPQTTGRSDPLVFALLTIDPAESRRARQQPKQHRVTSRRERLAAFVLQMFLRDSGGSSLDPRTAIAGSRHRPRCLPNEPPALNQWQGSERLHSRRSSGALCPPYLLVNPARRRRSQVDQLASSRKNRDRPGRH